MDESGLFEMDIEGDEMFAKTTFHVPNANYVQQVDDIASRPKPYPILYDDYIPKIDIPSIFLKGTYETVAADPPPLEPSPTGYKNLETLTDPFSLPKTSLKEYQNLETMIEPSNLPETSPTEYPTLEILTDLPNLSEISDLKNEVVLNFPMPMAPEEEQIVEAVCPVTIQAQESAKKRNKPYLLKEDSITTKNKTPVAFVVSGAKQGQYIQVSMRYSENPNQNKPVNVCREHQECVICKHNQRDHPENFNFCIDQPEKFSCNYTVADGHPTAVLSMTNEVISENGTAKFSIIFACLNSCDIHRNSGKKLHLILKVFDRLGNQLSNPVQLKIRVCMNVNRDHGTDDLPVERENKRIKNSIKKEGPRYSLRKSEVDLKTVVSNTIYPELTHVHQLDETVPAPPQIIDFAIQPNQYQEKLDVPLDLLKEHHTLKTLTVPSNVPETSDWEGSIVHEPPIFPFQEDQQMVETEAVYPVAIEAQESSKMKNKPYLLKDNSITTKDMTPVAFVVSGAKQGQYIQVSMRYSENPNQNKPVNVCRRHQECVICKRNQRDHPENFNFCIDQQEKFSCNYTVADGHPTAVLSMTNEVISENGTAKFNIIFPCLNSCNIHRNFGKKLHLILNVFDREWNQLSDAIHYRVRVCKNVKRDHVDDDDDLSRDMKSKRIKKSIKQEKNSKTIKKTDVANCESGPPQNASGTQEQEVPSWTCFLMKNLQDHKRVVALIKELEGNEFSLDAPAEMLE
ncbi:uncharacterized protein LOC122265802 [Penaeus japonicus]|uniref:uncharacterized protein LOC122265802 n=1 Tax=Penaeus japonicus TaxID=27405 RepID=UPI001C71261A|nr:uncharacterized protein LOC122265802 [Penaeus japonicus]